LQKVLKVVPEKKRGTLMAKGLLSWGRNEQYNTHARERDVILRKKAKKKGVYRRQGGRPEETTRKRLTPHQAKRGDDGPPA